MNKGRYIAYQLDGHPGTSKFDGWIHHWFKIVANAFQENTNYV